MKIEMKESIVPAMVKSVLLFAIGLLLIFMADATLVSISYLLGGILCAIGAVAIIQFFKTEKEVSAFAQLNIVYGVITILVGVVLILNPNIVGSLVPIFMGLAIIVSSACKLQQALTLRAFSNAYWKGTMIAALLSLICGLVILFNPFKTASIVTQVVGIFIAIYAILDMISTITMRKTTLSVNITVGEDKNTKKRAKEKVKDAQIIKEVKKEQRSEEDE